MCLRVDSAARSDARMALNLDESAKRWSSSVNLVGIANLKAGGDKTAARACEPQEQAVARLLACTRGSDPEG